MQIYVPSSHGVYNLMGDMNDKQVLNGMVILKVEGQGTRKLT